MYFSNREKKDSTPKKQNLVCPKCSFHNRTTAIYCEICFHPLQVAEYSVSKSLESPPPVELPQEPKSTFEQELRKPRVISGFVVLSLAIALWFNYALGRPRYLSAFQKNKLALYDSMSQVRNVPSGLFSYGGALYFASLVTHGMNDAMMQRHSEFNLRYTEPVNQKPSYANVIKMLLDGELSFAFNGRPLNDNEYAQAKLRDLELLQVPIAIDGIAVFGNKDITVSRLNLAQVRDIFAGKITNWQELGGSDSPISPILVTREDLEVLGIKPLSRTSETTQYVSNYTVAVRHAIATPGAISFASASLVRDQQGIKTFSLAANDSNKYISPIVDGRANLKSFKNGTYPLTRRLFIVIRQDGTPDQLAGKAYTQMLLSKQGQEIVEESGFVPLYNEE